MRSTQKYIFSFSGVVKNRLSVKILTLTVNFNQWWYGNDFFIMFYMCFENILDKIDTIIFFDEETEKL